MRVLGPEQEAMVAEPVAEPPRRRRSARRDEDLYIVPMLDPMRVGAPERNRVLRVIGRAVAEACGGEVHITPGVMVVAVPVAAQRGDPSVFASTAERYVDITGAVDPSMEEAAAHRLAELGGGCVGTSVLEHRLRSVMADSGWCMWARGRERWR